MKTETQRIAIAEACGWNTTKEVLGSVYIYRDPKGNIAGVLPSYLTDLNAMHDAEKTLTKEQRDDYVERLSPTGTSRCPYSSFTVLHATASQRAEAFLRVIGKWVDA